MTLTKTIGNYILDIVDIVDFKKYLDENKNSFSTNAFKSYLKAVDIPPKFFKEQPEETQEQLLLNREDFVREKKKYFNKVIVVLKAGNEILNACRLGMEEVDDKYEKLKTIEEVTNKFEHRSFIKDGYISYVVSGDIKAHQENKVLVIDFPILLNKKLVIHEAFYSLPDDSFAVPVEHIQYVSTWEVDLDVDYNSVKDAVDDKLEFLEAEAKTIEDKDILRENELITLALVDNGTISKTLKDKVQAHINKYAESGLSTKKLESLILDFEEEVKGYKQVTSLRNVNGDTILNILESDRFKALLEEMDEPLNEPELLTL